MGNEYYLFSHDGILANKWGQYNKQKFSNDFKH